jgi:hypothetical protein
MAYRKTAAIYQSRGGRGEQWRLRERDGGEEERSDRERAHHAGDPVDALHKE